jgi:hypothetical protein
MSATRPLSYRAALDRITSAKINGCGYTPELREALDIIHRHHEQQRKQREQARAKGLSVLRSAEHHQ